ncbi:MAG: putative Holliday junction resolvase YggF [Parcubacteria bacterium C7867-006]|nr:MAG: putative Holliday junction resolvase YggF [Parcubacteria bacterium C7867-006]
MKYLGIDYGLKNVGIAISDESLKFAFPLVVLQNSEILIYDIARICKENNVVGVVVGESKDFGQRDNEIMKEIKPFVERLKTELKVPIIFHPEFMTSVEAERLQGKNNMHDASAAALILKSYLDTNHG